MYKVGYPGFDIDSANEFTIFTTFKESEMLNTML